MLFPKARFIEESKVQPADLFATNGTKDKRVTHLGFATCANRIFLKGKEIIFTNIDQFSGHVNHSRKKF